MKKEFNEYKERMKGAIPLLIISIIGIIIGILMLLGLLNFNTQGMFDNYAPYVIIFLSGYSLYIAIKEIKRANASK